MSEDWLAAWDAATEEERRLVLAELGPESFVIAARREDGVLVVGGCTHGGNCIDILDVIVDGHRVTTQPLLRREESTGEDVARRVAGEFAISYPALSRVWWKTQAECEDRSLGAWLAKEPDLTVLAVVSDGARQVVTVLASYVIWHSSQSTEWGVQYVTIDEVAIVGATPEPPRRLLEQHIDIEPHELQTHDDAAATRRIVAKFLAG